MSESIRLLCYNIRSLRDDTDALFRVIRGIDADVVCLQETPRFFRWRSTMAAIARRSGMVVVTGGKPAGSNLIMSTLAVDVDAVYDIGLSRDRGQYKRGIAVAVLRKAGTRFTLAGTHLDLVDGPRLRHIHEIHARLDELAPPGVARILAGDMNCRPGEPGWQALRSYGTDVWDVVGSGDGFTYAADRPFERIDGVFVSGPVRPISATVVANADTPIGTDHCPLVVDLELDG